MSTTTTRLLAALVFCCGLSTGLAATSPHVQEAVFAIQPDNVRYLRYENIFDTATVAYTFGEIRLIHGGHVQRIPLAAFAGEMNAVTGEASGGEDASLLALGTSVPFALPPGPERKSGSTAIWKPTHRVARSGAALPVEVPVRGKTGTGLLEQTAFSTGRSGCSRLCGLRTTPCWAHWTAWVWRPIPRR